MRRPHVLLAFAFAGATALVLAGAREGRGQGAAREAARACPDGMVLAPRGQATLGAAGDPDALAPETREMGPLCIDRTEVTVARYRACVSAGACPAPAGGISFPGYGPPEPMRSDLSRYCNAPRRDHEDHPMNCVDAATAATYCRWEGGRLPDEAEWEYAARGPRGGLFPWGDAPPSGLACLDRRITAEGTCAVGSFPAGASPFGALDMGGDVWEWTASPREGRRVVRGGGWTNFLPRFVRATYRWPLSEETRLNCLGFRCVAPVRAP